MYGLNRLNSAMQLVALCTAAANSRRLLSSAAATAGISQISNRRNKYKREELPHSQNLVKLTCESAADGGVCDVYLVGTDHVCPKTWAQVKSVMQFVTPEAVFLELCPSRVHILTPDKVKMPTSIITLVCRCRPSEKWCVCGWKTNVFIQFFYVAKLYMICGKRGFMLGGDVRAAYEEAIKYGAKVILGDRPVEITLWRYWAKRSLLALCIDYLLPRPIKLPEDLAKKVKKGKRTGKIDDDTIGRDTEEFTWEHPAWTETSLHERDRYMSFKILEVARQHNSVVAVVGMSHLLGIQKNWKQPIEIEQLLNIPIGRKLLMIGARVGQVVCLFDAYHYSQILFSVV